MRRAALICLASAVAAVVGILTASRSEGAYVARHEPDPSKTTFDRSTRGVAARAIALPTERGDVLAYPPGDSSKPIVVYLHGVHGRAENGCPWMRTGAPDTGWVLCPEPTVKHAPGWSWTGRLEDDAPIVRSALDATRSDAPRIAVGFSQGAYVALDLVRSNRERFAGLVLLGAQVNPDAKVLAAAGVRRVVLGASAHEPWHAALERNAARLAHEGIASKFVSLGKVGHTYVGEDPAVLRDAIAWASAP